MKNKLSSFFKRLSLMDNFSLAAAILAIVVGIMGIFLQGLAWNKWNILITVFLLLGASSKIVLLFFDFDFKPLIPMFSYTVAFVFVIEGTFLTIGDYIRQITWVQGDYKLCFVYLISSLLIIITAVFACFFESGKKPDKEG